MVLNIREDVKEYGEEMFVFDCFFTDCHLKKTFIQLVSEKIFIK
jgi:hypothetical protein